MTVVEAMPPSLMLYADEKYTITVRLRDRFSNFLQAGGASISARLQYMKHSMHDTNTLSGQNSNALVEDNKDGTYAVLVTLLSRGLSGFPLTVNVLINLDQGKERPNGVDLAPIPLTFHLPEGTKPEVVRRQATSALLATEAAPMRRSSVATGLSADSTTTGTGGGSKWAKLKTKVKAAAAVEDHL